MSARPVRNTPKMLIAVTEVYLEAQRKNRNPVQYVAATFEATHTQATAWVRNARKHGYLEPYVYVVEDHI